MCLQMIWLFVFIFHNKSSEMCFVLLKYLIRMNKFHEFRSVFKFNLTFHEYWIVFLCWLIRDFTRRQQLQVANLNSTVSNWTRSRRRRRRILKNWSKLQMLLLYEIYFPEVMLFSVVSAKTIDSIYALTLLSDGFHLCITRSELFGIFVRSNVCDEPASFGI